MNYYYLPLAIGYLLLYAFLSWRRPQASLWILLAALPSYLIRFEIAGIPMTLLEGMILILTAVTAVRECQSSNVKVQIKSKIQNLKRFVICHLSFVIPIALFLLAATISMVIAPDLRAAAGIWKAYFIEPVLCLIVVLTLVKTEHDRAYILSALGVSALAVSTLAIYQHFTGWEIPAPWLPEATRRVTSFYGYPNAVGLYLAPIIVLALGQLILIIKKIGSEVVSPKNKTAEVLRAWFRGASRGEQNRAIKTGEPLGKPSLVVRGDTTSFLFWLVVIIFSIIAIIFSRTEGAWIALPAGLLLSGLLIKKYRRYASILTIITIVIVLTIQPLRDYTLRQVTLRGDSGATRLTMWQESFVMLQENWLLGAGLSGYQAAMTPYHKAKHIEIYLYPHNIFLNFWSEMGLLGLMALCWIILVFAYRSYKTPETYWEIAALAVLLIHGLVDVPYFKNDLAVLFWLLLALMILKAGPPAHPYSPPRQRLLS